MKTIGYAVALCLAFPAWAEEHTATWFAAHPREMNAQISACLDDPGHGKLTPNCDNASQGRAVREAAEARAHFAAMVAETDSEQIKAWRTNPQALLARLRACNMATKAYQREVWRCDSAFAIAQQMGVQH